jgi:hypothetical protein
MQTKNKLAAQYLEQISNKKLTEIDSMVLEAQGAFRWMGRTSQYSVHFAQRAYNKCPS